MTQLQLEAVQQWATPQDWEVSSQVTSEADFEEAMDYITARRLRLAHNMARAELLSRGAVEVGAEWSDEPEYIDLTGIALTPYLSAGQCMHYTNEVNRNKYGRGLSMRDARFFWNILEQRQRTIMGLAYAGYDKHDDAVYRIAEHDRQSQWHKLGYDYFENAYQQSKAITDSGYPVRFMMDGILFVSSAPIELDSLQSWLDMIRAGNKDVPLTMVDEWQAVIDAKRAADKQDGSKTYNDVVHSLAPGVMQAPYLAKELKASSHYYTPDDIWQAAHKLGRDEVTTWRDFRLLVRSAMTAWSGEFVYAEDISDRYPGLYILHCDAVMRAIDLLASKHTKANDRTAEMAAEMIAGCLKKRLYDSIADKVAF